MTEDPTKYLTNDDAEAQDLQESREEERSAGEMTFNQSTFLSMAYQAPQETVVVFEKVQEPADYSFIWFLGILAVILFAVFFLWIRRQNRS